MCLLIKFYLINVVLIIIWEYWEKNLLFFKKWSNWKSCCKGNVKIVFYFFYIIFVVF